MNKRINRDKYNTLSEFSHYFKECIQESDISREERIMALSPDKIKSIEEKGFFGKLFGKSKPEKQPSRLPEGFPISESELKQITDAIDAETKKPTVFINIGEQTSGDVSPDASVLGGLPPYVGQIPLDSKGKQLRFLIQINCKHLSSLPNFPHEGIIQLWLDRNLNTDSGCYRVLYFADTKAPSKLDKIDRSIYGNGHEWCCVDSNYKDENKQFNLSFKSGFNYLAPYSWDEVDDYDKLFAKHWNEIVSDESKHIKPDQVFDIIKQVPKDFNPHFTRKNEYDPYNNKLGGYPGFTQNDPRRSGWTSENSVLLLQLDSKGPLMWGDCGSAQVFIKKNDLEHLRFGHILFDWACY